MRQLESGAHPRAWPWAVRAARAAGASLTGGLIGALIGAATAIIQPHTGQPWSALDNSASPWLVGAFVAGALHRRRDPAVLAGLATLLVEVGAYFVTADIGRIPVTRDYVAFWIVCALAAGPVAGWAGWAWCRGGSLAHGFGAAFLPGTFIAEALGAYGLRLHYAPAVVIFLAIGATLFALLAWPGTRLGLIAAPARGPVVLAWTAAFAVAGVLVYGPLLDAVVGINSGGVYYP